ncbi:acyl carrier protein 1, chloroplastic-like [Aristolochia californica]|uniref:acyl carrier protein 1, chloroplastic-like n=1 Tax=Aristolochia californica TaxID=171875 RepID=UPI0035D62F67
MASLLSTSSSPVAALSACSNTSGTKCQPLSNILTIKVPLAGELRLVHKVQTSQATKRLSVDTQVRTQERPSLLQAQPETLQAVQSTIAKQLSIDECTVAPETKFADLGADSLDTVEIMMALEEKFGVSIGEGGAENVSTVQDAADLIEKVKAEAV